MRALRIQGLIFSGAALLVALAAMLSPRSAEGASFALMMATIVMLGVPHGALDTVFAQRLHRLRTRTGWTLFTLAYLVAAGAVVAVWHLAPTASLAGFLVISVAHFSSDPAEGTPAIARLVYGGALIFLPCVLHADEVGRLLSSLAGADAASSLLPGLRVIAIAWVTVYAVVVLALVPAHRIASLELAATALLAILAPPLLAFTVYFCGMHSARHILRTRDRFDLVAPGSLLDAALLPMLAVVVLGGAAWHWLRVLPVDARILRLVFVGLAALTVPHMALVDRGRILQLGR